MEASATLRPLPWLEGGGGLREMHTCLMDHEALGGTENRQDTER